MAGKALPEEQRIYTLKVTLRGSDPPIWRRFQIEGGATMGELHATLQAVMGWEDCHLHEFQAGRRSFTAIRPGMERDFVEDFENEDEYLVFEVLARKRSKLKYIYDFGDYWQHEVVVEQIAAPEPGARYPVCLGGASACPPEDSGGIGGYREILEALKEPEHPEYANYREWMSVGFDPVKFDLDGVNARLASMAEDAAEAEAEAVAFRALLDERYPEPVRGLLKLGDPGEEMPDYLGMGFASGHVPALIQMATDAELHFECLDEDALWGPVHAWRVLGLLGDEQAILPLAHFLRESARELDEFILTEIPLVLTQIGPAALPALGDMLRGAPYPPESQTIAVFAVAMAAKLHPKECRTACIGLLREQLERFKENVEEVNAILISQLDTLDAVNSAPLIERVMKAGAVDEETLLLCEDLFSFEVDLPDDEPPAAKKTPKTQKQAAKPKDTKKGAKKKPRP